MIRRRGGRSDASRVVAVRLVVANRIRCATKIGRLTLHKKASRAREVSFQSKVEFFGATEEVWGGDTFWQTSCKMTTWALGGCCRPLSTIIYPRRLPQGLRAQS